MKGMADNVRKWSLNPLIIAGKSDAAYDTDSLINLVVNGPMKDYDNIIWNFHPF